MQIHFAYAVPAKCCDEPRYWSNGGHWPLPNTPYVHGICEQCGTISVSGYSTRHHRHVWWVVTGEGLLALYHHLPDLYRDLVADSRTIRLANAGHITLSPEQLAKFELRGLRRLDEFLGPPRRTIRRDANWKRPQALFNLLHRLLRLATLISGLRLGPTRTTTAPRASHGKAAR